MTQMAAKNTSVEIQTPFHCKAFHMDMPVDRQRGFCAIQFRKGRDICVDCERGKEAAKETADEVRAALPADKEFENRSKAQTINRIKEKEVNMAENKLCSCGCGKGAVKDGLATKCYRKKYGKAPFPSGQKKTKKLAKAKARPSQAGKKRRVKGNGVHDTGECEGCKALQLQIDDLTRAENIMVAAGLATADKFEKARQIVRELAK